MKFSPGQMVIPINKSCGAISWDTFNNSDNHYVKVLRDFFKKHGFVYVNHIDEDEYFCNISPEQTRAYRDGSLSFLEKDLIPFTQEQQKAEV